LAGKAATVAATVAATSAHATVAAATPYSAKSRQGLCLGGLAIRGGPAQLSGVVASRLLIVSFLTQAKLQFFNIATGCKSIFRKIFEFKIWKEPMLVVKQTIPQQKALDLSFNLAP
jgi:hypothetical protein